MKKGGGIRFGIGRKLLLCFLLLSLVPIIVGGTIAFTLTKNQLEDNTRAHLNDLARDCGRKISYYVSSRYQDIKILAQAKVFKGTDREATQNYIDEVVAVYPYYKTISVIAPDGTIVACTHSELIGVSRADTTWFQRAMRAGNGDVIALDAYRCQTAGWEMVIGFNTPIIDKDKGEVVGVLATRVSMEHIIGRVSVLKERLAGDNPAYLLNRRGEIIAGPDEKEFLTIHRLYEFPVVKDLLAGRTGIAEYADHRGTAVISAQYSLKGDGGFNGWGWGILVTVPVSEAFRAAYEIRDTMILLALIIALLVTVFALFVSKRFSRPIAEVSKSASIISQGNLEPIRIDYSAKDEIGDLVSAFNKMTEDLHRTTVSRDSLAREIIERKRAEEKIEHLNLVLRAIRNVNQIITREKECDRLLKSACNNIIENRGYNNAWMALFDDSGGLITTVEAGLGEDFLPMVEQLKNGFLPECIQRSLSQDEVVVIEDSVTVCTDCPFSRLHKGVGAMTARLEYGGKVYGLLSASIPRNFVSDKEEQDLFKEVAGDIALALHSLELEEERERAEDSHRKSEERLKGILHGSPIPTYVIDKDHRVTYWNKAIEEYSGMRAEDMLGTDQHWRAFYDEKRPCMADLLVDGRLNDVPQWYAGKYRASYLIEGAYEAEDYFPRLGKWLYFTSAPIRDPSGILVGAVATNQDVTERKRAEKQIMTLSRQIIDIQEKERESLSREIHDNIGQLLATLKMNIFRMNKKIPAKLSTLKDQLSDLSYLVNKTIREIRSLSHALHPPVIEDLGLRSALEELCQDFKSYSEIRINWNIEPIERPLQSMTKITIYRILQEGLHNILKHSRATEADVRLTSSENRIEITIEDNGIGFVVDDVLTPTPKKRALGLISMRERLALIGGILQISSEPGKGTRIIASLEME
jgi:PAS domain S-box-containing protein